MEVLTIHGREFVKASKAARDLGYAPDYIGQLCRNGLIRSERVGRSWYVDVADIHNHKEEKRRSVSAKARSSLVKRISLVKKHAPDHTYSSRTIPVLRYEEDDTPLVPELKKKSARGVNVVHEEEDMLARVEEDEQKEHDHVDRDDQDFTLSDDRYHDDQSGFVPVRILDDRNEPVPSHSITPARIPIVVESVSVHKREKQHVPSRMPHHAQANTRGSGITETLLVVLAVLGVFASASRVDGIATALQSTVQYSLDIPALLINFDWWAVQNLNL